MLDDHDYCGRLSFVQFAEVVVAARQEAKNGEARARSVADALESVLRMRIARVRAHLRLDSSQADQTVVALVSAFGAVS